jgi:hypothetical protein
MKHVLKIIRNLVLFSGSQKPGIIKDEEGILCILAELEQSTATLTGDIERLQNHMDSAADSIFAINSAAKTLGCKVDRLSEVDPRLPFPLPCLLCANGSGRCRALSFAFSQSGPD